MHGTEVSSWSDHTRKSGKKIMYKVSVYEELHR
jgi:hypothetical protein